MSSSSCVQVIPDEKLDLLRRLDRYRVWDSLDERRLCLECGRIITGRQIVISGGTQPFDPYRVSCSTEGCKSVPMDWSRPPSMNNGDDPEHVPAELEDLERAKPVPVGDLQLARAALDADNIAHRILHRAWRAFTAARANGGMHQPPVRG